MKKIIIDCDPGFDDAVALLLAYGSKKFDIKCVTTCAGNQTLEKISNNTIRIFEYMGINQDVYMGAIKPLMKKLVVADEVHGESGLESDLLPEKPSKKPKEGAIGKIYEELMKSDEEVTLIATGPLTNIALLISSFPDVMKKIDHLTIMGGSIYKGNVTRYAEFNIFTDPESAYIVFNSGIKINMIGLDVTHKAIFNDSNIEVFKKAATKGSRLFVDIYNKHKDFYEKNTSLNGVPVHDACAVAYEIDDSIFGVEKLKIDIEIKDNEKMGCTKLVDDENTSYVKVCMDIDFEKFRNMLLEALNNIK